MTSRATIFIFLLRGPISYFFVTHEACLQDNQIIACCRQLDAEFWVNNKTAGAQAVETFVERWSTFVDFVWPPKIAGIVLLSPPQQKEKDFSREFYEQSILTAIGLHL